MNDPALELAFGTGVNLDLAGVFEGLLLAMVLGLIVAMVYRYSVGERLISPALQGSLVLLAMVGAMVMMVIGDNLARAFSLVGALAIVRFRTRLASAWDITFVFFALAVGIASGVAAWRVAIMGTVMISLAVFMLSSLPLGGMRRKVHLLRCDVAAYEQVEGRLDAVLKPVLLRRWLVEARSLRFGETLSYRWRIVLKPDTELQELLRQLSTVEGVERVVLSADDDPSSGAE